MKKVGNYDIIYLYGKKRVEIKSILHDKTELNTVVIHYCHCEKQKQWANELLFITDGDGLIQ